MKAITEDFITDLSVRECSAAFRVGAEASYGGMRKFASLVTKMQDRASAQFSFFTPRPDEVFGDLDEDPPTWSGGVTVPGVTKVNGTLEMVVQIYVWERGSHREVQIIAPYGIGEKGSTSRVLNRILQEFPATSPTDAPETPQEPAPISAPVAMATHRADAASTVVPATAGAVTFHTGPVQQPTQAPVAAKQPPLAAPRATAPLSPSAAAASGASSPSASTTGANTKTSRTPLIVGAVALGLAAIVGIAMTVASRGSSTPPAGSRQQAQSLDESDSGSASPRPRPAQLARSYSGLMHGGYGDATFELKLHEAQGEINGDVVWDHTAGAGGGYAGTQYVKGSRDGRNLTLKTLGWSRDTAADWSDEFYSYDLIFRDDRLTRFTGSMLCRVCGTGERVIEGAES